MYIVREYITKYNNIKLLISDRQILLIDVSLLQCLEEKNHL